MPSIAGVGLSQLAAKMLTQNHRDTTFNTSYIFAGGYQHTGALQVRGAAVAARHHHSWRGPDAVGRHI